MAEKKSGDYYYTAGTINEKLEQYQVYEDGGSLVFYDAANDTEVASITASGFSDGTPESLSDNTTGSADGSLQAVGDTSAGDESGAINNNFKEIYEVLLASGLVE